MSLTKKIEYLPKSENTKKEAAVSKSLFLSFLQIFFKTLGPFIPRTLAKLVFYFFTKPRIRAKHRIEDELLRTAQRFSLKFQQKRIQLYSWGNGQQTVLLVHGWESRGTAMRRVVPDLLNRGYKVVCFDALAHGDSEGSQTNLIEYADLISFLLNNLPNVESMITHSLGGAATTYALQVNKSLKINKLVMVAVPAHMPDIFENIVKTMSLPNKLAKEFKRLLEDKANMPLDSLSISNAKVENQVDDVLIVHDLEDKIVKVQTAFDIAEAWPNTNLLISNGLGHYRLLKDKEVISRIAAFV